MFKNIDELPFTHLASQRRTDCHSSGLAATRFHWSLS
ncbi:protein of unknown function [Burkholderia multivorans]